MTSPDVRSVTTGTLELVDHLPLFARIAAAFSAVMGVVVLVVSVFPETTISPALAGIGILLGPAFLVWGLYLAFGRRSATIDLDIGAVLIQRRIFGLELPSAQAGGRFERVRVVFRRGPRGGGAYWVYLEGPDGHVRVYRNPWPSGVRDAVAKLEAFTRLPVIDDAGVLADTTRT